MRVLKRPWIFENVLSLEVPEITKHAFEIRLGGDEHPGAASTDSAERLGHRLEVEHAFGILANELAHLINEEVEAEPRRLFVNVITYAMREALNGDLVVLANPFDHPARVCDGNAEVFSVRLVECRSTHRGNGFTVRLPCAAIDLFVRDSEWLKFPALVEIVLELRDVALVAVVALHLVHDLHEHFENGRRVVAANAVELLVNVEKNAARWHSCGLAQSSLDDLVLNLQEGGCPPLAFRSQVGGRRERATAS